ncbi:MAG: hypothetical protein GY769_20015, partial [bacterium]|nr:hypothetical protein [bacterium]
PPLTASGFDPEPVAQFRRWFEAARAAKLPQPDAMTLATADASGRPHARVVLLKGVDVEGFVFYTDYHSAKGRELEGNPDTHRIMHLSPNSLGSGRP